MYMSFIENTAPDLYLLRIVYHHLSKWRRSERKWGGGGGGLFRNH